MDKLERIKSNVTFLGYRVDEITYLSNPQFQTNEDNITVDFNVSVGVNVISDERTVIVSLEAKLFRDYINNNYPFSLSIKISGGFLAEEQLKEDELKQLGEINGTATLFPFLRSIVAGICSQANVNPVMLPLVNIYSLIKEQKTQQQKDTQKDI